MKTSKNQIKNSTNIGKICQKEYEKHKKTCKNDKKISEKDKNISVNSLNLSQGGKKTSDKNQNEYEKLKKLCIEKLNNLSNSFDENNALDISVDNTQYLSDFLQKESENEQNEFENIQKEYENDVNECENERLLSENCPKIVKTFETDNPNKKQVLLYFGNDDEQLEKAKQCPDQIFDEQKSIKVYDNFSQSISKKKEDSDSYLVSSETKKKYKKIGNCNKGYRNNADRLADLKKYDLGKWVELILTIHPYLPAIANFMETTIDKFAFSAYSYAYMFGGTEACMNDMFDMLDNKNKVINLYVLGNQMKELLNAQELKIVDCTINRHSKISEIAKQGRYRKVYLARDRILSRLTSFLKLKNFTPIKLINDYGKLNIVLYYA